MVDAANHPNITLHTYSEIESVDGYIGNFQVTIRKKARSVDMDKCTGCGVCMTKCPQKKIPNSFDKNLGFRPAIYVPFPQAVPNIPVIDREHCTKFINGKCGVCQKVCGPGAIDYDQEDQLIVEPVGAIVVATGFKLYDIGEKPKGSPIKGYGEFGHGKIPDVIDGMTFEAGEAGDQLLREQGLELEEGAVVDERADDLADVVGAALLDRHDGRDRLRIRTRRDPVERGRGRLHQHRAILLPRCSIAPARTVGAARRTTPRCQASAGVSAARSGGRSGKMSR